MIKAAISTAWDGKHQGYAHVREGIYWEACHQPTPEERLMQRALLRTDMPSTQKRWEDPIFHARVLLERATFRRL